MLLKDYLEKIGVKFPEKKEYEPLFPEKGLWAGYWEDKEKEGYNQAIEEISQIEVGVPLVPLDVNKVRIVIDNSLRLFTNAIPGTRRQDIALSICSKFGQPKTLSVEEMVEISNKFTSINLSTGQVYIDQDVIEPLMKAISDALKGEK